MTAGARLRRHLRRPFPLLHHLVLRTDTHAYCAGMAFFALVGFYPFCLLLLAVPDQVVPWPAAETVIRETLREYYPEAQDFLVRNLEVSLRQPGRDLTLSASLWILLGAAGFFVPLETAFNQLWGAKDHRPYWRNQGVGFLLTSGCGALAVLFVFCTASAQALLDELALSPAVARLASHVILRLSALGLSVTAIFLFYRYLPNSPVKAADVWPAAVSAGIIAELVRWTFLRVLPLLDLRESQGPYFVSVSFLLLAYVESFVLLGGAYVAARPPMAALTHRREAPAGVWGASPPDAADHTSSQRRRPGE